MVIPLLAGVEPHYNYFSSATHYQFLARRVAAVLGSGCCVLVTGDPPAVPQSLSYALGNVRGPGHTVIDIRCRPEMSGKKPTRLTSAISLGEELIVEKRDFVMLMHSNAQQVLEVPAVH